MNLKKYEEKIVSQMTCVDFLKFRINNEIFFVENIKKTENEFWKFVKKSTIIYRNKEYSFAEYNDDLKRTSEKFRADLVNNSYISDYDEIFFIDKNYYKILRFFDSIGYNISYAKYYADKSYQKLPESIPFEKITTYADVYLKRGISFFSSILWYGTCRDYLLQIFCARFNLYSEISEVDTEGMEFDELVKICEFKKIEGIKEKHKSDKEFCSWFRKLNICESNLSRLNQLNNSLKHRGGCGLKNFNVAKESEIESKYFNIPEIDIDEDYDLLIKAHNSIVKCYDYFLNKINEELDLILKKNTI